MAVVGSPAASDAVRELIKADGLEASTDPDMEEGEPVRSSLSGTAAGYELMHYSGRVATAFLYAEPADGFTAFPHPLPGGLSRGATRADVRARFGIPEKSGEAVTITGLGRQGAWDLFTVGGIRIHFQYTESGDCVRLVSVMAANVAP
ncbi:MAG: hypothetical protein K1X57_15800 [Gemmataceae bacterium]|nr:hypothetical protein [Gemmataceae bacterium]